MARTVISSGVQSRRNRSAWILGFIFTSLLVGIDNRWRVARIQIPQIGTEGIMKNESLYPDAAESVRRFCMVYGVEPTIAFAICGAETNYRDPHTVGSSGEIGIMQVTPVAMQQVGCFIDLNSGLDDQIEAGCAFLGWLVNEFGSDYAMVIRAYNVGVAGARSGHGELYLTRVLSFM